MTEKTILPSPSLFNSFWLGGFEAAHQKLCSGERVDMLAVTQHDRQVVHDYNLLLSQGIRTVREGVRWNLVDRGGYYDYSSFLPMLEAAHSAGIQVIWSLCHYGWPDDVDLLSPAFVDRFARYCRAVATCVAETSHEVPFYIPINEISFLTYAIGGPGFIFPCLPGKAHEVKKQLVRAAIAACEAIWEVDPRARIIHVDPTIQVVAPPGRPDLARSAESQQYSQFEAYDMLGGWAQPELGGHPRYLDIIGVNYYADNHWELERPRLSWEDRQASGDKRWLSFHALLEAVYSRYLRPIFIAETSHIGTGRGPWILLIAEEVRIARRLGIPIEGICLYPIIDRPHWHDTDHWHNSGLWDVELTEQDKLERVLYQPYADDLHRAMDMLAEEGCGEFRNNKPD